MISIILSVLGFGAACSLDSWENGIDGPVAYGTPTATFIVKGNVKSGETSSDIPSIRVVMGYDTTHTDIAGNYQVVNREFPKDQTFLLEFNDIDDSSNGEFQALDTIVEFTSPEFSGGSGAWDSGKTEKELNVNLKPEE